MLNGRTNSHASCYKGPLRVIAFITLWSFLFSIVGGEILVKKAWAARTPSELTTVGSDRASGSASFKKLDIETFVLPQYLGRIKDSFKGNSDRTVIHIQDAHCNYAAQHRINDIIGYLNKEHGIDTVNLEGGVGEYDLSIFTRIQDKDIRKKVVNYFVKEGLVNGAEYFAVNNPSKARLWGVEDTKLYIKNLNVYRESLKHKKDTEKYLKELDHIISNLKRHIYNAELTDLDQKYIEYKTEKLEFKDYLTYLVQKANQKAINIKILTNIYLLHQSLEQENKINFKMANIERNRLIEALEKMLSKNALKELVQKTVEFKKDLIAQRDYYTYLVKKANQMNFDFTKYPQLQKYIVYISTYEAINKDKLMEELTALETSIKENIFENDDQKTLDTLSKNLILMKKVFNIAISREDYKYYKKNEKLFNVQNYVTFINKKAPIYKITAKLDSNISALNRYRKNIAKFYDYSFKRDDVFLRNIKPDKTSILITGGFHTENLSELFKKKGISYISVMPNFKNINGYESPYFNLLAGKENGMLGRLEQIVAKVSTMQIFSMCAASESAARIWGKSNIDAFRAAIVIQAEIGKGRKIVIEHEGKEYVFGDMDSSVEVRMTLRELLDEIHQVDKDTKWTEGYRNGSQAVSQGAREKAAERIEKIADSLENLGQKDKAEKLRLVASQVRSGEVNINLVNCNEDFADDEHAGGMGIHINATKLNRSFKGVGRENRIIDLIVHAAIGGVTGDHFAAEAGESNDIQLAANLLNNNEKAFDAPVWAMTSEERRSVDRDFAQHSLDQPQISVRTLVDKILMIAHDFDRWEEKYKLQKQLVSLGREATPALLDILRNSQNNDEKNIALDAVRDIGDERAIDTLVDILSNNLDSYGLGSTAALGLARIGKAASPRLKTLLDSHGPKRNILLAIEQVKDESFIPALRKLHTDDNDAKRLIGSALLILEDKGGLIKLIDFFETSVKNYGETKEEATLTFINALLSDLLGSTVAKNNTKAILKTDPSLESRLAIAAKSMMDLTEDEFLTQRLIELLGLGTSEQTAKTLWELYARKGGNETLGRTIALAMKEVGSACIPYLIQGHIKNDLIFEILGDMGDASAVPFLLQELKEIGYSDYERRQKIGKAIEKIGEKALPHLLETFENEKEDNNYICRLLVAINSPKAIPKMIEILKSDISEGNKLNIIEALGSMEMYGQRLSAAIRQNPLLQKTLFDLTVTFLKDGLSGMEYLGIERVLKATATDEDASKLINLYNQNGDEVKKVILGALAARTDDVTIAFLISALSTSNQEILQASLGALDSLGKSGILIEYLKRNDEKQKELIGLLEREVQTRTFAISILGIIGTERCIAILIKELDRRIQQKVGVDTTLLEALMAIGSNARVALLSERLDLVAAIDRIVTESLLTPLSSDTGEETYKSSMTRVFKKWLVFIADQKAAKRPATRQELIETYLSQREQITNLIIKMKERLARNPDMTYEEIMKFVEKDIKNLSLRAQVRFRIGVFNYVRDREKIRKIIDEATKAGIKSGDSLTIADIQKDSKKEQFIIGIVGFLPESVQIFFLSDTVHIISDSESYGRMRYRQKTHARGAADGYNKLLPQERFAYKDSGGVFCPYQSGKVGEVELSGLLTFESLPLIGTRDGHVLIHEVQHRFFHGYAEDELREALLLRKSETSRLTKEINGQTGEEQRRSIEKVVEATTTVILFDYQNEMISKIIDGMWIKDKDITGWLEFYKQWYMDGVKEILSKIDDEQLRQSMFEKIFDKAEEILKTHKPTIDKTIELKAQLIEREEKIDHKVALEKANAWVATFFQTISVDRFDRLDWLVSKLTMELEKGTEDEVVTRQTQTVEAFNEADGKADTVKVVVGIPKKMNRIEDRKYIQRTVKNIGRGLAQNGFGERDDISQVVTFEIDTDDPEQTQKNYEQAMKKANEQRGGNGRIVLFAPQMEIGPQLAKQAQDQYKEEYITVIPDAYADAHPEQSEYPDIVVRVALARHVAFYYNGNDQTSAINAINNLLGQVSKEYTAITNINQLLNGVLKIVPIISKNLKAWQISQEAVVTAL